MNTSRLKTLIKKVLQESETDKVRISMNKVDEFESKGCDVEEDELGNFFVRKSTCKYLSLGENIRKKKLLREGVETCPDTPSDCTQIASSKVQQFKDKGCQAGLGKDGVTFYYIPSSCPTTPPPVNPPTNPPSPPVSTNPGFPSCISRVLNVQYTANKEAIFSDGTFTYTFKLDGTVTTDKGNSGTWSCDPNDSSRINVSFTSVSSTTTPPPVASTGGSSATSGQPILPQPGEFPFCVLGLKKSGDYYYSTATDDNGNLYSLFFTKEKKVGTSMVSGFLVYITGPGPTPGETKTFTGVYNCYNDGVGIESWDGGYKLNVKQVRSSQLSTQKIVDLIDRYNSARLPLTTGESNQIDFPQLRRTYRTIRNYISKGYRGEFFENFYFTLVNLKKLAESQDLPPDDISEIDGFVQDLKTLFTTMKDNINTKYTGLDWEVISDPFSDQMGSYVSTDIKTDLRVEGPVNVFQLKGELTGRQTLQQTDALLQQALGANKIDQSTCETYLQRLVTIAGRPDLLKGASLEVADLSSFDDNALKGMKQIVTLCRRVQGMYSNKKYEKALNYLVKPEDDKYAVNFAAKCARNQPPNEQQCQ